MNIVRYVQLIAMKMAPKMTKMTPNKGDTIATF